MACWGPCRVRRVSTFGVAQYGVSGGGREGTYGGGVA